MSNSISELSPEIIQRIEKLNRDYICALDSMDMKGWLACFNKKGTYIFIAEENERQGLPIAFMLDDCYERLQDRVTQVVDIQIDSTEHYQTRHFTQLVTANFLDDNCCRAEFNFSVFYTRSDTNETELLCVGRYQDVIHLDKETNFIERKAVTDTNVLPRYFAYPV